MVENKQFQSFEKKWQKEKKCFVNVKTINTFARTKKEGINVL